MENLEYWKNRFDFMMIEKLKNSYIYLGSNDEYQIKHRPNEVLDSCNLKFIVAEILKLEKITIDNISLYYEFMSDEDFVKIDFNIFDNLFNDRIRIISNSLFPNVTKSFFLMDLINKHAKQEYKCLNKQTNGCLTIETSLITRSSLFGVKDNLQSIDEYIEEIKQSEAYKEYIAKKS